MTSSRQTARRHVVTAIACIFGVVLNACTIVGPKAIRSGRLTYNEAITETNNQQLLLAILHNRYDQTVNLLAVSAITANVRVSTSADVQIGIGDSDNFEGNLVPFSAGAVYEENPTISYIPVAGSKYLRQLTSPIPISALAQLSATMMDPGPIYRGLISSVNGIRNPDFLFPGNEPDPRFERVINLLGELIRAQRIHWVTESKNTDSLSIAIRRRDQADDTQVEELLRLLGVSAPGTNAPVITLPVSLALEGRDSRGIGITTRSISSLMQILSAAVEIPERDKDNGSAAGYPPLGPVGSKLRIRQADHKPDHATVAVPFRDGWFYIDERDGSTKRFFRILTALWSVAISDTAGASSRAPVLTVPVSR
jgi:hypothetical protein